MRATMQGMKFSATLQKQTINQTNHVKQINNSLFSRNIIPAYYENEKPFKKY